MLIKIIAGTFGHRVGERVLAVRAGDDPIEVADGIGERLIKKGVAVLVDVAPPASVPVVEHEEADEVSFPEFDMKMTRAKLEEIALDVGIEKADIKACSKKADLFDLLVLAHDDFLLGSDAPTFNPEGDIL